MSASDLRLGVTKLSQHWLLAFLLLKREWAGLETSKPSNPFQAETRCLSANQTRRERESQTKETLRSSAWERSAQTRCPSKQGANYEGF
ncbi:hypothetical protein QQF64_015419 [Cirrhinus molitorella]|uniref:Secreted protein n=1 Tax=Cirrhinus molitorella TaxID=172907 RepID=A0ABR3NV65_9TELE